MDAFVNTRPSALRLARNAQEAERGDGEELGQHSSKKRKVERSSTEGEEATDPISEERQTRSRSKRVDEQTLDSTLEVVEDSQDDESMSLPLCP